MFRSKKRPLTNLLLHFIAITSIAVNSLLATHVVHAAPVTLEEVNNSYYASILLSDCYRQKIGKRENPNSQNGDALHSIPPDRDLNSIFKADAAPFVTTSVYIGRYYEPNDGIVACNEGTILKKAMQDLGYPELSSFLLAIGYKKVETTLPSGSTAVKYELSADDRSSRDSAERAIRALGANQTDSSKYIALKKVFDRHCQVTAQNTSQGGFRTTYTEIVKDPNDSERYITKDTPVDLLAKESGKTPTSKIKKYDYNDKNTNCRDLLSEMNGLAGSYAVYMSTSPNASSEGEPVAMGQNTGTPSNEIACAAGAIGWLLCPLMTTLSDSVMLGAEIIGNFMQFEPLLGGGPDSSGEAIRGIWQRLVGISNLLLVVAFMVVIFSQATSIGLSAYGIKKMLPRIIAAAILINISYYICALLVDVFNIIGANIGGVIESASSSIPITGELRSDSPGVVAQIAGTVTALITVVGLWGFAAGSVAFLVPILVTALVSVLFIAVVLALRHIMAILLIIVSPLAFAAMILPNTADLFKKWWKGLVTVLALYPVIMILAYGSLLVSKIILATAPDKAEDNFIIYFLTVAIALVVQVAWIFALKFIVTWGGGLIGRIGGMINDPQKGLIDRSKNWAKSKDARSTLGQSRAWRQQAGDDAAKRRTYGRINSGKGISGTAAHVGAYGLAGLWGEKGILPSSKAAGAIVDVQAAEMADKIHTQSVSYARQKIAQEFSAKDRDSGADGKGLKGLAREAEMAARAGDQVRFDAISSFAASGGADEYRAFHEDMQGRLNVAENPKYRDMFGKSMGFVGATMGGELGPKNPALASVLQTQNPETSIVNSMYNDLGMRKMYNKVGADKHATYSSDEAKAAALFATDDVVRELIENPGGKHSLGDSARKAYQAEYDKIRNGQARQFANGVGYNENGDGIVGKVRIKDNGAMKDDDGNLLLDPPANPPGQDSLPGM